jgi:hypothetical protein
MPHLFQELYAVYVSLWLTKFYYCHSGVLISY